jgi:hypothetical protein
MFERVSGGEGRIKWPTSARKRPKTGRQALGSERAGADRLWSPWCSQRGRRRIGVSHELDILVAAAPEHATAVKWVAELVPSGRPSRGEGAIAAPTIPPGKRGATRVDEAPRLGWCGAMSALESGDVTRTIRAHRSKNRAFSCPSHGPSDS